MMKELMNNVLDYINKDDEGVNFRLTMVMGVYLIILIAVFHALSYGLAKAIFFWGYEVIPMSLLESPFFYIFLNGIVAILIYLAIDRFLLPDEPFIEREVFLPLGSIDDTHALKMRYEPLAEELGITKKELGDGEGPSAKLNFNVLAFADGHNAFHTCPKKISEFVGNHPDYEAIFLLGDLTAADIETVLSHVYKDVPILAIAGNHDERDVFLPFPRITDVHGKAVELPNGIVVAGMGGSNRYKRNAPKRMMLNQYESLLVAECVKEESQGHIDILLSHDKSFIQADPDIAHTGLLGVTKVIKDHPQLSYHLYGHDHEAKTLQYSPGNIVGKCIYQMEYLQL